MGHWDTTWGLVLHLQPAAAVPVCHAVECWALPLCTQRLTPAVVSQARAPLHSCSVESRSVTVLLLSRWLDLDRGIVAATPTLHSAVIKALQTLPPPQ